MIGVFDTTGNFDKLPLDYEVVGLTNITDAPKVDALYIDWVSKDQKDNFMLQAMLMDHYTTASKVPMVVYDRNLTMSYKEYNWLRKFDIYFLEPALNNREGFKYQPQWTEMLSMDDFNLIKTLKRKFSIAYNGYLMDKLKPFEKYYKKVAMMYPEIRVVYEDNSIPEDKIKEYSDSNLSKVYEINWSDVVFTILIDNPKNYRIGYLDPYIFKAMRHGCVPFIDHQHRYFVGMFDKLVTSSYNDIRWLMDGKGTFNEAIIQDIYEDIENLYPEFTMEYAAKTIKDCFR